MRRSDKISLIRRNQRENLDQDQEREDIEMTEETIEEMIEGMIGMVEMKEGMINEIEEIKILIRKEMMGIVLRKIMIKRLMKSDF